MPRRCERCGRFVGAECGKCLDCGRIACRRCKPEGLNLCSACWGTKDGRAVDLEPARDVIRAAVRLNKWLLDNVGHTADWPVHLHVDNLIDAECLAASLASLSAACKTYLATNPETEL